MEDITRVPLHPVGHLPHLLPRYKVLAAPLGRIHRKDNTGTGDPEENVHQLPEEQRSNTGTGGPEEDVCRLPEEQRCNAGTRGPGEAVEHPPAHPKNAESNKHHKQDLSRYQKGKTLDGYEWQSSNIFLQLAITVADNSPNRKNCYVCGFIPHSTKEGLPLMALPASFCDTCHILYFNSTKEHCTGPNLSSDESLLLLFSLEIDSERLCDLKKKKEGEFRKKIHIWGGIWRGAFDLQTKMVISVCLQTHIYVTPVDQETFGPGLITMLNVCPHTSPPRTSGPTLITMLNVCPHDTLLFASPFVYLLTESAILCSDCIKCDCFICSGSGSGSDPLCACRFTSLPVFFE